MYPVLVTTPPSSGERSFQRFAVLGCIEKTLLTGAESCSLLLNLRFPLPVFPSVVSFTSSLKARRSRSRCQEPTVFSGNFSTTLFPLHRGTPASFAQLVSVPSLVTANPACKRLAPCIYPHVSMTMMCYPNCCPDSLLRSNGGSCRGLEQSATKKRADGQNKPEWRAVGHFGANLRQMR